MCHCRTVKLSCQLNLATVKLPTEAFRSANISLPFTDKFWEQSHNMVDCNAGYTKESDATPEEIANRRLNLQMFDIWSLGITIVIGGQYFSWNEGYAAGFGSYLISTLLIGSSYVCLCVSNAEISSALPFAGGAYGLARVSLGMYPGFIIGCLEAAEYIVYVSTSAISLSMMIISLTKASIDMLPLCCFLFYASALFIHLPGGKLFWRSTVAMGLLSIGILLIYIFGSIPWCDFIENASSQAVTGGNENDYFIGGFSNFLSVTPLAAWFYVGVESLNLSAAFVEKPKVTIGRASIACVLTLFITSIGVLFVSAALSPSPAKDGSNGVMNLANDLNPLNNGFIRMFNVSADVATILSIPATYATAFGFIFAYGRVITAMAKSSLLPPIFTRTCGSYESPYVAILVGSLIGYILCVVVYFKPIITTYLFNFCILSGFMAYISQFVGFILFRIRHASEVRLFVSPLGIPGAVFGICVFSLSAVSIMGFQNDDSIGFIAFLVSVVLYTIYYFSYAKKRQKFSSEEKFIFVLQIVKFNERARLLAARGTLIKRPAVFRGMQTNSRKASSSYGTSPIKPSYTNQNSVDVSVAVSTDVAFISGKDTPEPTVRANIGIFGNSTLLPVKKANLSRIHAEDSKSGEDCIDLESNYLADDEGFHTLDDVHHEFPPDIFLSAASAYKLRDSKSDKTTVVSPMLIIQDHNISTI